MQNLDVTKTEAAWSSLAGKVYVPHSEEEYRELIALLDSFIDEVGEDESHPLASLMEIVGVLIEKYEDEHVLELSDVSPVDPLSDNYANAAERARQFFISVSVEADALNAKINAHADRMGGITKQGNRAEFEAIISDSAVDLESFAQRMEVLLPDYRRDLELTTEGFDQTLESLDPSTSSGIEQLHGMRREARKLTETAREAKLKVVDLRRVFETLRDANYDPRLTKAARRLVVLADDLTSAFEDLETLALKVSFSAGQS
jgi:HTH-type transcriptional regulator/antitoxin HigA